MLVIFLDRIFDVLSDGGILIISAPKEDHNLIEGHLNGFICSIIFTTNDTRWF